MGWPVLYLPPLPVQTSYLPFYSLDRTPRAIQSSFKHTSLPFYTHTLSLPFGAVPKTVVPLPLHTLPLSRSARGCSPGVLGDPDWPPLQAYLRLALLAARAQTYIHDHSLS